MGIDFSPQQWDQVRETYRKWWAGELDRPLVPVQLVGRDSGRPMPAAPLLTMATCADLSIPAEALVDRLDWELSRRIYLGDAFPYLDFSCFGPGVMAAFVGATLDNSTGGVWFHPSRELPIAEIHLEYDPNNVWLRRIKQVYVAMMERWQRQVLVGMTDLGGNLDILSTFRPSEGLLLDLYDHPDEVKRVLSESHELWHRYFAELTAVLQPYNPGYGSWCDIYSDRPYYMLQCDFAYMISTEMFKQFVLPELEATTRRLDHSFYHLDGKGQLPHLDCLLGMERLNGIQWVPGDGNPDCPEWPEVYQRILGAGKKAQLWGSFAAVYELLQHTGVGAGVHYRTGLHDIARAAEIRGWLKRFGVA